MKSIEIVAIEWADSYGATSGWQEVEGYCPGLLTVISIGKKIYENEKVVALSANFAEGTTYTPDQANGIMVIPKCSIQKVTTFSYPYSVPGLEQKPQRS